MSGALPDEDPFGDRAWLEEQKKRKERGRFAILEDAEEFEVDDGAGDGEDEGGGGGDDGGEGPPPKGEPDDPAYDTLRIPRIFGKMVRWVPVSLPDDGPVTPLGVQGGVFWFLNPHGELIAMKAAEFGQSHIEGLFAPKLDWLWRAFPQFNQQRQWRGFQAQYARSALMSAAGVKGVFDARDKVRGLGCWKADDGRLIQHLGDRILVGDTEHRPGEIDGYVYPGRPPVLPPVKGGKAAVEATYRMFQTWHWARGELDARLLIGFMGTGILGAALDWRPMTFITGDAGYGKSELMNRMKAMLPGRMVATVDASPAALRQMVNQDSVMVLFDEIEADALTDQAQQVMKLARVAASGGSVYRGGKDHNSAEFTLRGCFGFSAIVPPSMRNQDMQRLAFLRLVKRPSGKLEALTPARAREIGQAFAGRLAEGWERFERTLDAYKAELVKHGHDNRSAMQFGTLLASADVLLLDGDPDSDTLDHWASQLKRDSLFEYESNAPAWLTAWRSLLQSQPEPWRSDGFPTVGEVLRRYVIAAGRDPKEPNRAPDEKERMRLHDRLGRVGLAVVQERKTGRLYLAIPPKHQAIASIFAGTDLQARGGEGAWTIVLRNAPKIEGDQGIYRVEKVPRLNRMKCTLYALDALHEGEPIFDVWEDEADVDRTPDAEGPAPGA